VNGWALPVRLGVLGTVAVMVGCGGSTATSPTTAPPTAPLSPPVSIGAPTPGLQPEPNAAATGDIPDNQVFLLFRNTAAGYSMRYPEGWAQLGSGRKVVFSDKNNVVRVVITKGSLPRPATVRSELDALRGVQVLSQPAPTSVGGMKAMKAVYSTQSAPNAVTGRRVTLIVDRYYIAHAGREAIVDLGTPRGVDNVDAYRLMVESFRWR
jgi:hypothetical protein